MSKNTTVTGKIEALRLAEQIGCSGAHQHDDGGWMPCVSHEIMTQLSKKGRKKIGKRKRQEWEMLREMPIGSISTIEGGGLVSGPAMSKSADFKGPESVRDNDPDVFLDPESARFRSRQLGCIGISRRSSTSGRIVWMPCTNMSDYASRTGSTALGRRNQRRAMENVVRTVLSREKAKLKRKVVLHVELNQNEI